MFLMTSLLRKRLFIGYFITGFIVLSMVAVMINERCRLKELENLIIQINEAYENTNKVHLYITNSANSLHGDCFLKKLLIILHTKLCVPPLTHRIAFHGMTK